MAWRLLKTPALQVFTVLTLASLHTAGCIIPQEDNFLDPLPPARNRPPRIILEQLSPPNIKTKIFSQPNCPETAFTFAAAVEDPDVNDPIFASFWVDYDPEQPNNPRLDATTPVLPSSGSPQRSIKAQVTFDARQQFLSIFSAGQHTLDLVVSDTALGPNRQPLGRSGQSPDGGDEPGYSDTFTWFVTTENECGP